MANYKVTLSSSQANKSEAGQNVTADTVQAAQKAANLQAAQKCHVEYENVADWKATITPA
jgi:hypothetical protein